MNSQNLSRKIKGEDYGFLIEKQSKRLKIKLLIFFIEIFCGLIKTFKKFSMINE